MGVGARRSLVPDPPACFAVLAFGYELTFGRHLNFNSLNSSQESLSFLHHWIGGGLAVYVGKGDHGRTTTRVE